jgi:starch synthase (maltosyl-transferring)
MVPLNMSPEPGARLVRHAGDVLTFTLSGLPPGFHARLRTNLGRVDRVRDEVIRAHFERLPLAGASWRDVPMREVGNGVWRFDFPLSEVGFFKAKAYAIQGDGTPCWPAGPDVAVSVHPSWTRSGNILYCAFPRMFGPSKSKRVTVDPSLEARLRSLDDQGYSVIPPSGTLRGLMRELPHIVGTLGCRILHLLPISPTPTTLARFGRFGSPYALQDLTAIDPALVEFDRRSTGLEQFAELAYAVHSMGARLMLDVVINHTGWGSRLWEEHPGWFVRSPDGEFVSPGAWDVTWEDLVELDQRHPDLWEVLAEAFLIWCRRGVDGFRCDAGYKIPAHVWQYITARVRTEFPDTVFLLEGLGGSWEATEALLGEGGMQWAYSELFQNFGGQAIGEYLEYSFRTSASAGTLIHYSETHDNSRLAAQGRGEVPPESPNLAWSRLRNRLCALTSVGGGFGFTNGVEWAATEQVNVHSARGMAWGSETNLVAELSRLNHLLLDHPCFVDGARLVRLSPTGSPVYALRRDSAEGLDSVLVLVNTEPGRSESIKLSPDVWAAFGGGRLDLLAGEGSPATAIGERATQGWVELVLEPGAAHCLATTSRPVGLAGEAYRRARARADWGLAAFGRASGAEGVELPEDWTPWTRLGDAVDVDAAGVLARASGVTTGYRPVVIWQSADATRITLIPPGHWLLVRDVVPFRARWQAGGGVLGRQAEAVPVQGGYVACFPPHTPRASFDTTLEVERYHGSLRHLSGRVRSLAADPDFRAAGLPRSPDSLVLLTNGRGAMSHLRVNLGTVRSKYDCLFAANLDSRVPVDRHVWVKRVRVWVNADGFITPLNFDNLLAFEPGPPAHWRFVANAGDGRAVEVHVLADLLEDQNTFVLDFLRPEQQRGVSRLGRPLEPEARVVLTVRLDLEDRNFHWETKRNSGADHFFNTAVRPANRGVGRDAASPDGFEFVPAPERQLRVWTPSGRFQHDPEWAMNIPHPVEASRGQEGSGDAYSPGWFELPLLAGGDATLVGTSESADPDREAIAGAMEARVRRLREAVDLSGVPVIDGFARQLVKSVQAFVVRREDTRSVIAGYPWFLDWGRDSLIAARGLLAAGMRDTVRDLLITFGRFAQDGTLPNSIHGADASNRDTTDAPLWYGVVAEELAALDAGADPLAPARSPVYSLPVDADGRTLASVLRSIACGYLKGTPNGIRVDADSGLVWSPSHFTWMDTNYPAGTPREGYPVEIQALWIRLLRQLGRMGAEPWEGRGEPWADLAKRAEDSLHRYFWLDEYGWYADVLLASRDLAARIAPPSNALRSNALLVVALGMDRHPDFAQRARRLVEAAARYLVVPGALRSLAPLPVVPGCPVYGNQGGLLNDPDNPYWPRYEGDEDTRRKPAYHNGTAWTWTFPAFCEAMVRAYPEDRLAWAAARAYLGSADRLMGEGCLGQLPEIADGDAPHTARGCDAQAWSVTEVLRVWRLLDSWPRPAAT